MARIKLFLGLLVVLAMIPFGAWQLWHAFTFGEIWVGGRRAVYRGWSTFEARPFDFAESVVLQIFAVFVLPVILALYFPWSRLLGRRSLWGNGEMPRKRIG